MKNISLKLFLALIVFLTAFGVKGVQVFADVYDNKVGTQLTSPEKGWKRYDETYTNLSNTNVLQTTLDIKSDSYEISEGTEFTTDVMIYNANNIYAGDINIDYDENRFEYIGAATQTTTSAAISIGERRQTTTSSAISIYHEDTSKDGTVRLIVASKGEENAINGDQKLLKLKFRAKNVTTEAAISVSYGCVANGYGEEFDTLCGGKIFTILNCDVNGDGIISLGDLAITARLYENPNYYYYNRKADVNKNGSVEDIDLKEIVKSILSKEK